VGKTGRDSEKSCLIEVFGCVEEKRKQCGAKADNAAKKECGPSSRKIYPVPLAERRRGLERDRS